MWVGRPRASAFLFSGAPVFGDWWSVLNNELEFTRVAYFVCK